MYKLPKRPVSKLKRTLLITCGVLLLALIGVGAKFAYEVTHPEAAFDMTPQQAQEAVVEAPADSVQPTAAATPSPTIDPAVLLEQQSDLSFLQKRVNILALGIDESTERANWGSFRTDTMILITVNFDANRVDMISVPRDSYVKIYNKTDANNEPVYNKINGAFGAGGGANKKGFEYAMKTVSMVLGDIPIEYYIAFNMNVVKDVVNAMGGVDYNVDTEVNMNGRTYSTGMQHLDGQGVLDYSRQRHGSSDIARVDRQQRVLLAIFDQMKQTNQIVNIPKIYSAVSNNMNTNLSMTQISALALYANRIGLENINRHTLPGEFLNIGKTSYWGILQSAKQKLVKEIFGKTIAVDEQEDVRFIKQQLAENRKLIEPQLKIAASWLSLGEKLTKEYGAQMTAEEKSRLKEAIGLVQDASDEEQKDLLDSSIPVMEQVYNAIAQRLGLQTYSSYGTTATASPSISPTPIPGETAQIVGATPTPTPSL